MPRACTVSDSCFIHTSKVSSLAPTAAIFLAWKQDKFGAKQHNNDIFGAKQHNNDIFGAKQHNNDKFGAKQHNNDIFGAKQHNNDNFDGKQSQQWHWKKLSRAENSA